MDKDEVVSDTQSPCDICKTLTFNRPNWDGTITCSLGCTDTWIRMLLSAEGDKWHKLSEDIRMEIAAIRARSGANGSH
ncbi:MAG: hypothetical protein EBW68_01650 [Actinobacteria bacterium]|nr:hypothetical protein [Actinomycetota bacterium]